MRTGAPSHSLVETATVLAVALSDRRRRRARLDVGPAASFTTDLLTVYVPSPSPFVGLRALTCGIALQAAPSKEAVAGVPLERLSARERQALVWAEGEVALGWVIRRWPGLARDLAVFLPDAIPGDPEADGRLILEAALSQGGGRYRSTAPPVLFGNLGWSDPIRRSTLALSTIRLTPSRSRLKKIGGRLPSVSGSVGGDSPRFRAVGETEDLDTVPIDRRVGFPYPEWDVSRHRYRPNFVTVLERHAPSPPGGRIGVPPEIAQWFRRSPDRTWFRRLDDGTELDLDAFFDHHTRLKSGEPTDGRVYARMGEGPRDIATAVLLDASASLQAGTSRVFALELLCADALASAMADSNEQYAIFAFSGESRHRVEMAVLADFGEARRGLPSAAKLAPSGYTRLGAALRHAARRLLETPASRRILLSIGDGLPSDEGYEGRYAEADVAKAVEEATAEGIIVFHVGVGTVRNDPVPAMFGLGRSLRLRQLRDLAPALAAIHAGLGEQ